MAVVSTLFIVILLSVNAAVGISGQVTANKTADTKPVGGTGNSAVSQSVHSISVSVSSSVSGAVSRSITLTPSKSNDDSSNSGSESASSSSSQSDEGSLVVYFHMLNKSFTPSTLKELLQWKLWDTQTVKMGPGKVVCEYWIQLSFGLLSNAKQAYVAANNKVLPGVQGASYVAPEIPSETKSKVVVISVVVVVLIVLAILILLGVFLYYRYFREKEWILGRYDEDCAMNSVTTPVNLNELLLTNLAVDGMNSQDAKSQAPRGKV
ncbi:hypothetical protein MOQ_006365 [Trypanosoma cruzi marinkellei]|uniref:Uncharacterized protein n=1 Tax=Trypanosoma cruzi marinkellei TaxID=85056 RepID=K2MVT9_TRYCR|nr:hypothetical protein MOQ_006365 [Trypanosoma cruzi marinkellei]